MMNSLNMAAEILGRKGGKAKVPKGFAMLSPDQRAERARQGAAQRWAGKTREEQFWDNVKKDSGVFKIVNGVLSECWAWTAGKSNKGYAYFSVNGKAKQAYKIAYEWEKGSVPDGLHLDHLCRTHECVRPDHLEPVTQRENTLRGETIFAAHAKKTTCSKGHPYDSKTPKGGRYCSICQRASVYRRRAELKQQKERG